MVFGGITLGELLTSSAGTAGYTQNEYDNNDMSHALVPA
jgi:hypothetical protein